MVSRTQQDRSNHTIRKILDAAAAVFAEAGFEGARMDTIARRAGVNKATIYYHIGDKQALYAEVLHDVFGDALARIAANLQQAKGPVEKLKIYIRNISETQTAHPHLAPIMLREVASGGTSFPEVVARDIALIFAQLADILEEGNRQGLFVQTAPFIVHLMIVGTFLFYNTSGPLRYRHDILPEIQKTLDRHIDKPVTDIVESLVLRALLK